MSLPKTIAVINALNLLKPLLVAVGFITKEDRLAGHHSLNRAVEDRPYDVRWPSLLGVLDLARYYE